jgi:hypothetical protein
VDAFWESLFNSRLLTSPMPAASIIVALYCSGYLVHRKALALFHAQSLIAGEQLTPTEQKYGIYLPLAQLSYIGAVFLLAVYGGGAFFTFLGGGLIVVLLIYNTHGLRTVWFYHTLAEPGAATGAVSMSAPFLIRSRAGFYLASALTCLLAGLLMCHLALLGGAFILGATGLGYLRRARQAQGR